MSTNHLDPAPDIPDALLQMRNQLARLDAASEHRRRELQLMETAAARLDGAAFRVIVFLRNRLDFDEFRTVKLFWLARTLHIGKGTASKALSHLSERGFLVEGPSSNGRSTVSYRLQVPD